MKKIIIVLLAGLIAQVAFAGDATTNMHVGATVAPWVRASNSQAKPSVETNSKTERCTIENTDSETVIHC